MSLGESADKSTAISLGHKLATYASVLLLGVVAFYLERTVASLDQAQTKIDRLSLQMAGIIEWKTQNDYWRNKVDETLDAILQRELSGGRSGLENRNANPSIQR